MTCVACRKDAPTVTDAEVAEFHRQVAGWDIVELDPFERRPQALGGASETASCETEVRHEREQAGGFAGSDPRRMTTGSSLFPLRMQVAGKELRPDLFLSYGSSCGLPSRPTR